MQRRIVKPSPNEEAEIIRKEKERRRIERLIQVRAQAKQHAKVIRTEYKKLCLTEQQLQEINMKKQFENEKKNKMVLLQSKMKHYIDDIGEGHRSADTTISRTQVINERRLIQKMDMDIRVEDRFDKAMKEVNEATRNRQARDTEHIKSRHKALEAEKKRAKDIACLPPPPKDLISFSDPTKGHRVIVKGVEGFSSTHYNMPTHVLVSRTDHERFGPSGSEVAQETEEKLVTEKEDVERRKQEQEEKAWLRHKHALAQVRLEKEHQKLNKDLEEMERQYRFARQQQISQMPPNLFQPAQRRIDMKMEKQRDMERAFEKPILKYQSPEYIVSSLGTPEGSNATPEGSNATPSSSTVSSTESSVESKGHPVNPDPITPLQFQTRATESEDKECREADGTGHSADDQNSKDLRLLEMEFDDDQPWDQLEERERLSTATIDDALDPSPSAPTSCTESSGVPNEAGSTLEKGSLTSQSPGSQQSCDTSSASSSGDQTLLPSPIEVPVEQEDTPTSPAEEQRDTPTSPAEEQSDLDQTTSSTESDSTIRGDDSGVQQLVSALQSIDLQATPGGRELDHLGSSPQLASPPPPAISEELTQQQSEGPTAHVTTTTNTALVTELLERFRRQQEGLHRLVIPEHLSTSEESLESEEQPVEGVVSHGNKPPLEDNTFGAVTPLSILTLSSSTLFSDVGRGEEESASQHSNTVDTSAMYSWTSLTEVDDNVSFHRPLMFTNLPHTHGEGEGIASTHHPNTQSPSVAPSYDTLQPLSVVHSHQTQAEGNLTTVQDESLRQDTVHPLPSLWTEQYSLSFGNLSSSFDPSPAPLPSVSKPPLLDASGSMASSQPAYQMAQPQPFSSPAHDYGPLTTPSSSHPPSSVAVPAHSSLSHVPQPLEMQRHSLHHPFSTEQLREEYPKIDVTTTTSYRPQAPPVLDLYNVATPLKDSILSHVSSSNILSSASSLPPDQGYPHVPLYSSSPSTEGEISKSTLESDSSSALQHLDTKTSGKHSESSLSELSSLSSISFLSPHGIIDSLLTHSRDPNTRVQPSSLATTTHHFERSTSITLSPEESDAVTTPTVGVSGTTVSVPTIGLTIAEDTRESENQERSHEQSHDSKADQSALLRDDSVRMTLQEAFLVRKREFIEKSKERLNKAKEKASKDSPKGTRGHLRAHSSKPARVVKATRADQSTDVKGKGHSRSSTLENSKGHTRSSTLENSKGHTRSASLENRRSSSKKSKRSVTFSSPLNIQQGTGIFSPPEAHKPHKDVQIGPPHQKSVKARTLKRSEMIAVNKRLYSRLPEVKLQKQTQERAESYEKNRAKAKEYQKKLQELMNTMKKKKTQTAAVSKSSQKSTFQKKPPFK